MDVNEVRGYMRYYEQQIQAVTLQIKAIVLPGNVNSVEYNRKCMERIALHKKRRDLQREYDIYCDMYYAKCSR